MIAKDKNGNNALVHKLEITTLEDVRLFFDAVRKIKQRKRTLALEEKFDHTNEETLEVLKNYNVVVKIIKH